MPVSFSMFGIKATGRSLGGGIRGHIPQTLQTTDVTDSVIQTRFLLREAWYNNYKRLVDYQQTPITPFRAVTNSGDLFSRKYYSCGGPCQTYQSRPGLHGLRTHFGHIADKCDGTGVPPAACNIRYVYDSSNYTRYLKEKAVNKLYNDLSYGGDDSHTSQSAIRAIHRY